MKIKDENIAIKQTQLDEIKWFVCFLKTHLVIIVPI
jgi:hypothetical protein